MFHRDTFRLIRKTGKRFITILLMVLIGVGFMVGLMSSAPTMRVSVDRYFDESNFMDLQLYSSYGFERRDIQALKNSENVDSIYPTKFTDVMANHDGSVAVTRVQELDDTVNRFYLTEGRIPSAPDEALALGSSSFGKVYDIGDTVQLYLEDSDLSETLSVTEYKIVGTVKTPQYMASAKETSTLNNLSLSTVIYVRPENFIGDYYTSVYLTFKGAKEYTAFTDEYKEFIEENTDDLNKIIRKQETVRRDKVLREITEEVEKGEKELEEEITKAQKQIDDGRKQLEDGYIQILVGESSISANETQIAAGEKEIAANEKLLAEGEKQVADGKKLIEQETGTSFEEASVAIKGAYGIYNLAIAMTDEESNATVNEELTAKKAERETLRNENSLMAAENLSLSLKNTQLDAENEGLKNENEALAAENLRLTEQNKLLEEQGKNEEVSSNNIKIAGNTAKIADNAVKITANETEKTENSKKQQENNEKTEENNRKITVLNEAISSLESISALMGNAVLKEIPDMIDNMFGGDVKAAYDGVVQLENARSELENGKIQLAAAKAELEAGKKQIADAKAQLVTGRVEYEKGLKELEDAQKELDEEYEKARIELDKARQQMNELPDARWIVLDRDSHFSTYMFENNATQMEKIGLVFPVLFFLVAALVCMTTMKRLVDEQRSQIGIFSALGFSKGKIISKYVIYAFSASIIGSVVSIPMGMNIFPVVIYFCWKLMYDLPDMVLTMPAYIAVLGVCSFTLLMVAVTYIVVRGILKENPSRLMRPKAPKTAKKVFLENISFIWKRLSFTSKVTARNIIRYKSRFFMTVVGVAGSTSLLVLGFAIKGSISQVVSIQYGDIIRYDTTVTMEDADYTEDVLQLFEDDNRVQYAVPYMSYSAMAYTEDDEKAIQVYIMDEDEIADVIDLRTRTRKEPLEIDDGAVVSEKYAKLYGISAGDEITLESANGIKKQVEVTGICEMYTGHYLFISRENYQDIYNETVHNDCIALTTTDGNRVVKDYSDNEHIKTIADFTDMKSTFNNMFDSLDIIIVVITLAAGSLALVVIMNLTEVNISERMREIATLKVLGFNNKEVYSYIFKEVFILSLIGILFGLPLGRLELIFVMDIIDMEMVMFSTVVQPMSYFYGFAITLVFTVLVMLLMRKTLRNVQMVESLKSVE